MPTRRTFTILTAVAWIPLLLFWSLTLWAAPVSPRRPILSHETQSLADLSRLRLDVRELPDEFADAKLTRESIAETMRQILTDAAFEIVDDPDAPALVLDIAGLTDEGLPDAMVLWMTYSLKQSVTVHRIERDLVLPTYWRFSVGLIKSGQLERVVNEAVENNTKSLIRKVQVASNE